MSFAICKCLIKESKLGKIWKKLWNDCQGDQTRPMASDYWFAWLAFLNNIFLRAEDIHGNTQDVIILA